MSLQHRITIFVLAAVLAVGVSSFATGLPQADIDAKARELAAQELSTYEVIMDQGGDLNEWQKLRYDELMLLLEPRVPTNPLDNQGGPDGFGYRYVDNQGGDSATYDWIELSGDPDANWLSFTTSHDDDTAGVDLSFSFPLYGTGYTHIKVGTNGHFQFTTVQRTAFTESCLPTTTFTGPVVLPFWDDLNLDYGGQGNSGTNVIAWRDFGDHVVIEYDSIGHCCSAGVSHKFEALLYADGRIKFQYNQLIFGTYANTQTIGIQASATGPALQYVCDATGHQPINGLAIWFAPSATGVISGTVTDDEASPLPNVRVRITETGATAYTDAQGNYLFPMVAIGTYAMTATRHGYDSDAANNVVVNDGQTTDVDFELASQGLVVFASNDVPVTIPTTVQTVTSTLTIDQSASIEDLDVMVNITHTYIGDLRISLTSPDQITVVLFNQHGAGGDNMNSTIFDNNGDSLISVGTPPYDGSYIPDGNLTLFNADNMQGEWTLTIEDLRAGDGGTLNAWEIYIAPGTATGGAIAGVVTSQESGDPISGAVVAIPSLGTSRTTNGSGQYSFGLVAAGTYTMNVSAAHYDDVVVPNVVVTNGQTTTADVAMPGNAPNYSQDFEESDGGWIPDPTTGGWTWGTPTVPAGLLPHSGTHVWGTVLTGNYPASCCFKLTLSPGLVVQSATATVEFWRWWDCEQNYDGCNFKVSIDGGTTWTTVDPVSGYGGATNSSNNCIPLEPAWTGHTGGAWTYEVMPIGQFVGQVPEFRFTFSSDGSVQYPGYFFDDMTIWGLQPPFPVGTLTGTVRQYPSNNALAGAWVVAGTTDSVQTNAQGQYSMDIQTGTYNVTFRHANYCDSVRTGVQIMEDQTTTLNIAMKAPAADISVSSIQHEGAAGQISTSTFTIENTGDCPLTYSIADDQTWLSEAPAQGSVQSGQTTEITVTYDATNLGIGDYDGQITVTHTATGSPVAIPVTLHIPDAANDPANMPTEFALLGNYPNPFNAVTEIKYDLPQAAFVTITLYNVLGQDVRTLTNNMLDAGHHVAVWDGRDDHGLTLTSGLYIMRLEAAGHSFIGKVMMLK